MQLKVVRRITFIGIISLLFLLIPILLYKIPSHAIRFDSTYRVIDPSQRESKLALNSFIRAFKNPNYIPGRYRFTLTIQGYPHMLENGSYLYLVVPYIAGTSMSVFWNGQFIGSQGDTVKGNSNIWNSAKIFTLPSDLFLSQNTVRIEMTNPYEAGFPLEPYMLSSSHGAFFIGLLRFFSDNLIFIIVGALAVLSLIVIISGTRSAFNSKAMIYFGLASLCTVLFLSDFMTLQELPLPLLEFKRAVAMLRHLAAIFALLGFAALNYVIKSWFNKIFLSVQALCIIFLLLPRTMVDLKNLYSWTFIAIAPLPIYLLIQLVQPKNRNSSNGLLLGGVFVASILAIRDTLLPILGISSIFLSHYGFSIMILAAASFIVSEFISQNQRLATEQIRAARFKEDSMRDPLTGAYNRNIINEVVPTLRGCFSILVFDLNDLKLINDTYGHLAGDEVLEDLAHILNECAIENKIIVRTGGDEFLMILPSLNAEQADHVISDLYARISRSRIKDSNSQGEFKYSASIGSASIQNDGPLEYQAFAKLLDEADQRMYIEKERNRHLHIE